MGTHKKKPNPYLVICVVSGVIAVLAAAALGFFLLQLRQTESEYQRLAAVAYGRSDPDAQQTAAPDAAASPAQDETPAQQGAQTEGSTEALAVIPIDFSYLRRNNSDVVGWIVVPGTNIDYPVLFDSSDDLYYLTHTYTGKLKFAGSIFMQDLNRSDFTDFNTVLYGHNMATGIMFSQLHRFEERAFFNTYDTILVYTPESVLTYRVFAAYKTDNDHILLSNRFDTREERAAYLDGIPDHTQGLYNKSVSVTPDDWIITLSTCIGNPSYRYVVQGVLISCEPGVSKTGS